MSQCPWDLLVARHRKLSKHVAWRPAGFLESPSAPSGAQLAEATRVKLWPLAGELPPSVPGERLAHHRPLGQAAESVKRR